MRLKFEQGHQSIIELDPVGRQVILLTVSFGDLMVKRRPYVDYFILIIKHKYFVTLARIVDEAKTVVDEPLVAYESIELEQTLALTEPV